MGTKFSPQYTAAYVERGYFQTTQQRRGAHLTTRVQLRITMDEDIAKEFISHFGFGKIVEQNNGTKLEIYAMPRIKKLLEYCISEMQSSKGQRLAREMLDYLASRGY